MKQRRTVLALLALGILFISPVAWGCEEAGIQNCTMSNCPMPSQRDIESCHDSEVVSHQGSSYCGATPEVWIACCEAAVVPEPAKVDSASSFDDGTTPLVLLAERVVVEPPSGPPDFISEAISARQHDLGRYTLLSSFLL